MSIKPAADAWRQLRQGGHHATDGEIPSVLAGVNADAGPVRYALGAQGEGRLLLPLSQSERVPKIPDTPTLKLKDAVYQFEGSQWRFLDLTCLVRELDGVFAEVAGEISSRITAGHAALEACVSTLSEFRMLLVPRSQDVGSEEIAGLIGELLLLNELLDLGSDATGLWRGPLGDRHDFRAGNLAIEVKTTNRSGSETMRISSVDQLLEPAGGSLWVVRYTIERTKGGQITIGSLFNQAAAKADDPAEVRNLLSKVGCLDPLSGDWNSMAFELQESRTYAVCEGFPRIVPATFAGGVIPAGTSKLEYTVDLTIAHPFRLGEEQAEACRKGMIECLRQA